MGGYNEARKIVDALLADLRLKAITDPLHQTIASLQRQVRDLRVQVDELRSAGGN